MRIRLLPVTTRLCQFVGISACSRMPMNTKAKPTIVGAHGTAATTPHGTSALNEGCTNERPHPT